MKVSKFVAFRENLVSTIDGKVMTFSDRQEKYGDMGGVWAITSIRLFAEGKPCAAIKRYGEDFELKVFAKDAVIDLRHMKEKYIDNGENPIVKCVVGQAFGHFTFTLREPTVQEQQEWINDNVREES